MEIALIGLSHKTAPVAIRERVAVAPDERVRVRDELAEMLGLGEVVVISTCNRTEFYLHSVDDMATDEHLLDSYAQISSLPLAEIEPSLYVKRNREAVQHLFTVAAGLDAMIVGETQILGQARDAYEDARAMGATGPVFNKLFQGVIRAAKKIHAETEISAGAVSVSYAAAELSRKIFEDLSSIRTMVIGAGETGRLAAVHLKEAGAEHFVVANRSREAAGKLAADVGGEPISLDDIGERLGDVDIVIGCAQTPQPLVDRAMLQKAARHRRRVPMFFIDLGMPRNFEDGLNGLHNVYSYTLDDLAGVVAQNIERRKEEALLAENLIDEEVARFSQWQCDQAAVPVIRDLNAAAESIRLKEVEKYKGRFAETEHDDLDQLTKIIVKRLLQAPILQLKEEVRKEKSGIIAGVRQLFRLG